MIHASRRHLLIDDIRDGKWARPYGDPALLREGLDKAVVFDTAEVGRYMWQVKDEYGLHSFPCLAPSYPIMWFDGVHTDGTRTGTLIVGHEAPFSELGDHTKTWSESQRSCRWVLVVEHFGWRDRHPQGVVCMDVAHLVGIDDNGAYVPGATSQFMHDKKGTAWTDENGGALLLEPFMGLSFVNSVNVPQRVVHGPPKVNAKRLQRGRRELVSYREILVPGYSDGARSATSPDREKMRLHLVRGHFKRRKTGVFWWHPFARGNYDEGVTVSSYKVGPS